VPFHPDCPSNQIFYSVLNEQYAIQIARDWNAHNPLIGEGYVTRFAERKSYLEIIAAKTVGSTIHQEYWIPAEELAEFNDNIVGRIEVTREFLTNKQASE
jgi:hypothetical protein